MAATSRRYRALRADSADRGSAIRVSTAGGSSKSFAESRKNVRSCDSTVGLPSRDDTTTASPRRLACGTWITSPGRSGGDGLADRVRPRPLPAPAVLLPQTAGPSRAAPSTPRSRRDGTPCSCGSPPGPRGPGCAGPLERHDPAVGEELRERGVQQLVRLLARVVAHQVHGHVVRGPERRGEVVRARGGERRPPARTAPAAGRRTTAWPSSSIPRRPARPVSCVYSPGVRISCRSPWNFQRSSITTVFAGMLIPSESVSVANTTFTRPGLEQLLDRLLERRQHPGVVRGDPRGQPVEEVEEPQRDEVLLVDPRGARLGALADVVGLLAGREAHPRLAQPPHALVAAGPAEHEVDRREHALRRRGPRRPPRAAARRRGGGPPAAASSGGAAAPAPPPVVGLRT